MKTTTKFAILGLISVVSFIPMMVLAAVNAPGEAHKMSVMHSSKTPLTHREVGSAPEVKEPTEITLDEVKIVVPRQVHPRTQTALCKDGEVRRVGALKASSDGARGVRYVTLRCYK